MKPTLLLVTLISLTHAQEPGVFPSYRASTDVGLTADPGSSFWKGVKGVALEKNILGVEEPALRSEARSRWTNDNLYFLFIGPYDELTLYPNPDTTNETYKLWEKDVFELYLGANFENISLYGEFQISPQGEFLDLGIDSSRPRPGWNDERLWSSGFEVKSRIDAAKKIWYGEMRIPIASLDKRLAKVGNELRVNVYRLHGPGPGRQRHFLAWQNVGIWNPHRPEKFGMLRLVPER